MMRRFEFFQNCWVVTDLEAAIRRCHDHYGAGPFFVNEHSKIDSMTDRGSSVSIDFSIAIAQSGDIQFEFVVVHDDKPELFRGLVPQGKERLHHMGCILSDYDGAVADLRRCGIEIRCEGKMGEIHFAFADTVSELGCMIELIADNSTLRRILDGVRRASQAWDGRELIQPFARLF